MAKKDKTKWTREDGDITSREYISEKEYSNSDETNSCFYSVGYAGSLSNKYTKSFIEDGSIFRYTGNIGREYDIEDTRGIISTDSFDFSSKKKSKHDEIYFKKKNEIYELEEYSEKILDIVSKNVKKYRKLREYTQMELSLEIGMSGGAYLGRAELRKPKHHFNIKHIAKIAKVLDIPICKFFEE